MQNIKRKLERGIQLYEAVEVLIMESDVLIVTNSPNNAPPRY